MARHWPPRLRKNILARTCSAPKRKTPLRCKQERGNIVVARWGRGDNAATRTNAARLGLFWSINWQSRWTVRAPAASGN